MTGGSETLETQTALRLWALVMIAHAGTQWLGQAERDSVVGHSLVPTSLEISSLRYVLFYINNHSSNGAHGESVPSKSLARTTFTMTMILRLTVATL